MNSTDSLFPSSSSLQCHQQQPICRSPVFTVPKSPTSAAPCRKYLILDALIEIPIDRTYMIHTVLAGSSIRCAAIRFRFAFAIKFAVNNVRVGLTLRGTGAGGRESVWLIHDFSNLIEGARVQSTLATNPQNICTKAGHTCDLATTLAH